MEKWQKICISGTAVGFGIVVVSTIMDYRELKKLKKSYQETLDKIEKHDEDTVALSATYAASMMQMNNIITTLEKAVEETTKENESV